jgi:2-keto-3-deoxy-L-rhamnonate aldolase RhmA
MSVEKLKNGATLVGTMLRLTKNSAVALVAKNAGLDFIMPIGGRGFGGVGDHSQFKAAKALEFMPEANKKVLTIAQIETALAIENIEKIAAVEGIDALLVGPNDLSNSLGVPGELFSDINLTAIRRTAKAAKDNGKIFGLHGPDKMTEMLIEENVGLTLIMSNHDVGLLQSGMAELVKKYKR